MTPSASRPTDQDMAGLDDAELLTLFRHGHHRARMLLQHRHAYMAQRMVRHLGLRDPEAVTSRAVTMAIEAEPFTAAGPTTFRSLLFAAIRRLAEQAREPASQVADVRQIAFRRAAPERHNGPDSDGQECSAVRAALPAPEPRSLPLTEQDRSIPTSARSESASWPISLSMRRGDFAPRDR